MNRSLIRAEVAPFLVRFTALVAATMIGDAMLHLFGWVWIGRYLGIPGTLLIVLSLAYSLRKRKVIQGGSPQTFLKMHEFFTWFGAVLVFVHAGVHFNAVLPWLAALAMMVNVISGMIGRTLLIRSRRHLAQAREQRNAAGLSDEETENGLFWDAVTYELMTHWRAIHFPISYAFAVLTLGHLFSVFLFWNWP
ncbi:MAG: hypothetical protein HQL96_13705 [Magnetococcales bacterium]|nr:hypothetical protein [Magnetococcales bacterium]